MFIVTIVKYFRMKISKNYHKSITTNYWSKAPKTHGSVNEEAFTFYAEKINELIQRYIPGCSKKILDHGAGEGSIAEKLISMHANDKEYEVCTSEMFEKYRKVMTKKKLTVYDAENLPENTFDGIFMNGAFYYIHPRKWKSEIERLLKSIKDDGNLFLTDVPTVRKIPVLNKKLKGFRKVLINLFQKITTVYQFDLGGFFVNEKKIKKWFPQTIIEDEWCDYRSFFIIKK